MNSRPSDRVAAIRAPDERTELLDGAVISVPPSGEPHAGSINRANATGDEIAAEDLLPSL